MTTKVTVEPAGHHVRITTTDHYMLKHESGHETPHLNETSIVLKPGQPAFTGYATTTRMISVVDLDAAGAAQA